MSNECSCVFMYLFKRIIFIPLIFSINKQSYMKLPFYFGLLCMLFSVFEIYFYEISKVVLCLFKTLSFFIILVFVNQFSKFVNHHLKFLTFLTHSEFFPKV